jgi:hypothetical protein
VRYEAEGDALHHALCHCGDCQASAGAPAVSWIAYPEGKVRLTKGLTTTYAGKSGAQRQFCPACGTGLLYTNADTLPGIVDIQAVTLDDAGADGPAIQIQCAEKLPWFDGLRDLPAFDRYPAG